jgi:hypothetical protein
MVKSLFNGRKIRCSTRARWFLLPWPRLLLDEIGSGRDLERAKENFLVAAELRYVHAMVCLGVLLDKDDAQRFVWLGRAAVGGYSGSFLNEMSEQIHNFNSRTGRANVVFAIGRALKGHINNEQRTVFGSGDSFDARIGPANQALHFYEFQLQSYRKAVDIWTIIGLRNRVVKDIRKMVGKMIWNAREEATFLEKKQSAADLRAEKRARLRK